MKSKLDDTEETQKRQKEMGVGVGGGTRQRNRGKGGGEAELWDTVGYPPPPPPHPPKSSQQQNWRNKPVTGSNSTALTGKEREKKNPCSGFKIPGHRPPTRETVSQTSVWHVQLSDRDANSTHTHTHKYTPRLGTRHKRPSAVSQTSTRLEPSA